MGFLDRLFGSDDERQTPPVPQNGDGGPAQPAAGRPGAQPPRSPDELAIERYRYLLRTAPPETIEQVHAEAFAKLTDAQRQQVLAELSASLPDSERPGSADPRAMARAATRAEYTQPGFMERTLGPQRQSGGPSFGAMVGSSILGTVAGYVIGSALVSAFLAPSMAYDQGYDDGSAEGASGESGPDDGAAAGDGWGDSGSGWGGDAGGSDAGADFGGFGGDFGGDFGF
ncbi:MULTISPECIES: hypothetical protein [Microbacterium]|uniref:hypothetical protein n=1 Tax=Microbacterium TaxID=33882 RepID=UPI00146CCA76|nr:MULTISPECIES: hypothetical protein [Microbacterium]